MLKDREGFSPAIVLTVICIITAFLLSMTYGATKDKISANTLGEQGIAMKVLLPEADSFPEAPKSDVKGVTGFYEAKKGSETIGYIVMSEGTGYGGKVPVIVAFNLDKTLAGVTIAGTQETPGFGKLAEEPAYQEQFKGLPADKEFTFSEESDKTDFDQVSGATATSTAIRDALNNAFKAVQALGN